jgi:hypothetical protein
MLQMYCGGIFASKITSLAFKHLIDQFQTVLYTNFSLEVVPGWVLF